MYAVHLRFTGKRVVGFQLVIIELFPPSDTAEALRAKINGNSAFLKRNGHFGRNFR